jgi:hypothetical protein
MGRSIRRYVRSAAPALVIVALYSTGTAAQDAVVHWVSVKAGPVAVMLDPSPTSTVVGTVPAGTLLPVRQVRNGWYFVTLPKEVDERAARSGWLTTTMVVASSAPVTPSAPAPSSVSAASSAPAASLATASSAPAPTSIPAPTRGSAIIAAAVPVPPPARADTSDAGDPTLPSGLKDLRALRDEFDRAILALEGKADLGVRLRRDQIDQAIRNLERRSRKVPATVVKR